MKDNVSTPPTVSTPAVSLRERSTVDLTRAIRLPADEEYVLNRTRATLKLFYDPGMDNVDRAAMLDEFRRALASFPRWAVAKGFDEWARTMSRRPSPAEIAILASRAIKNITDELTHRAKSTAPPPPPEPEPDRKPATADRTAQILAEAGFTPRRFEQTRFHRMAGSQAELDRDLTAPPRPHWTEGRTPDDPEMIALRAARDSNPLIRESREAQAKAEHFAKSRDEDAA